MFVIIGKGVGLRKGLFFNYFDFFFGTVWLFFSNARGYSTRSKALGFGGATMYMCVLLIIFPMVWL